MPIQKKPVKKKSLIKSLDYSLDFLPEKYEKNMEYHCLSIGQFNLIDIVEDVVKKIGPCDVDLAVWTAANSNLQKAFDFVERKEIKNMRWMFDPSFKSRQPKYVATLRSLFSNEAVRTIPTHAKFILLYNDNWSIIIQTSMNLNQNKRLESFTVIEDEELVNFYKQFVDDVFEKIDPDNSFSSQETSYLQEMFEDPSSILADKYKDL